MQGALFAMKRVEKSSVINNKRNVRMMWMEREIMIILKSQFTMHLECAFQTKAELFFLMPFLKGGDLRFHLDNHPNGFNEAIVKFFAAEILLGLEDMHQNHIVYRDLKPDNILLSDKGHVCLTDFGLSRILKEPAYLTKGCSGSLAYLSPEAVRGKSYGVTCDLFSFGVVLYELLHGDLPWTKRNGSIRWFSLGLRLQDRR